MYNKIENENEMIKDRVNPWTTNQLSLTPSR